MDPRTTILIGSITSGLMAIVLSSLARASPLPVPGLRGWVRGAWLIFLAMLLLGLRDRISNLASVTLGNAALMLAYIVWLAGTHAYLGRRLNLWVTLCAWALTILVVSWYILIDESFRVRTVTVTMFCALVSAYHATVLFKHPASGRHGKSIGIRLVGFWQVALALAFGARGLHAIFFSQGQLGLLSGDSTQVIYTAGFTVCNLVLVIGFATMASDFVRLRIEEQALRDGLTGVLNRRALFEVLSHEISRSQRSGQVFCIVVLDVDHFKSINDRFGHVVGDSVLVQLCKRVTGLIRPHDVLARYGGEEFVVVMPLTGMEDARRAVERLLVQIAQGLGGPLPDVTVSAGLAQWDGADASVLALVARADAALYRAKGGGRNRVETAPVPTRQ